MAVQWNGAPPEGLSRVRETLVVIQRGKTLWLTGPPVRNPANLAHATWLARQHRCRNVMGAFARPEDATLGECHFHRGLMWLSPEVREERDRLREAGEEPPLMCLLCVLRYVQPGVSGMALKRLPSEGAPQ